MAVGTDQLEVLVRVVRVVVIAVMYVHLRPVLGNEPASLASIAKLSFVRAIGLVPLGPRAGLFGSFGPVLVALRVADADARPGLSSVALMLDANLRWAALCAARRSRLFVDVAEAMHSL